MATGTSIFLVALGAILAFAIDAEVAGIDVTAIGVILMSVGTIGIVVSLAFADRIGGRRTTRVVEDRDVAGTGGRVVETRTTTREQI